LLIFFLILFLVLLIVTNKILAIAWKFMVAIFWGFRWATMLIPQHCFLFLGIKNQVHDGYVFLFSPLSCGSGLNTRELL
jgi:hypothetical protein